MEIKHNVVGWFEIPVTDMERAIKFYQTVFGFNLTLNETARLGFIGKENDNESQLGDFGVRKYDEDIGRFTSIDPLFEKYNGWNPYQYSANNPVNFLDPRGKEYYVGIDGELLKDHAIKDKNDKTVYLVNKDENKKVTETRIGVMGGEIDITHIMNYLLKRDGLIASQLSDIDYGRMVNKNASWDFKNRTDMIFGLAWTKEATDAVKTTFSMNLPLFGSGNFSGLNAADVGNFHAGFVGNQAGIPDTYLFMGAGAAEITKDLFNGDLRYDQLKQFGTMTAPYGDEIRDFLYNSSGIEYSRRTKNE